MAPLPSSVYTSTEAAQKFASFTQKFSSLIKENGLDVPKKYGPFSSNESGLFPSMIAASEAADPPDHTPTVIGQLNRAAIAAHVWVYKVSGPTWTIHSGTSQHVFVHSLGFFKASPLNSGINWGRSQVPVLMVYIQVYSDGQRSVPVGIFFTPNPSFNPAPGSQADPNSWWQPTHPYYIAAARVLTLPEVQAIVTSSAVQSAASPAAKFARY